jgi:hypothetical protein
VTRTLADLSYALTACALLLVTFIVIVPILGLWSLVNGDAADVRRATR